MIFRFADRDMLMHFHWGLGVGHTYAHSTTGPVEKAPPGTALGFDDEATLAAPCQSGPETIISDRHIDGDEDDSDGKSSWRSSSPDLDDSDLDNSDTEIAAMYNWDSQYENSENF